MNIFKLKNLSWGQKYQPTISIDNKQDAQDYLLKCAEWTLEQDIIEELGQIDEDDDEFVSFYEKLEQYQDLIPDIMKEELENIAIYSALVDKNTHHKVCEIFGCNKIIL
jgi:hypothetical protein